MKKNWSGFRNILDQCRLADYYQVLPSKVVRSRIFKGESLCPYQRYHPAVAPAEFGAFLLDDCGLEWADAWNATVKTMSYTNHTIWSEALENGMRSSLRMSCRGVYQTILEIDI